MADIYDWSLTAASNSNADSDINWSEGQAPSTVNNSARVMMTRVKELLTDIGGSLSAGGTANGLTVTAESAFTAYANGQIISFRATADNTGAATLNVNGVGAKAIRKMDSTGDVALIAGEIQDTGIYVAQYSSALNGAAGAWLLINPTISATSIGAQPLDADLTAIAALAKTDGNFIVGDGSTWVVESGATVRTSLGLGTSATVNTGTSGATIPLLNGANTHSGAAIFSSTVALNGTATVKAADNVATTYPLVLSNSSGTQTTSVGAYGMAMTAGTRRFDITAHDNSTSTYPIKFSNAAGSQTTEFGAYGLSVSGNYTMAFGGDLTITPTGGDVTINGTLTVTG